MKKNNKISVIVILCLIALTLAFIWGNSFLSKNDSATESTAIYNGFISNILNFIFGEGTITHGIFRKLAHAGEFFVLGLEILWLYVAINRFSIKKIFEILFFGLAVATVDECIQIISDRGPSVKDVVIDFIGYVVATILVFGVFYIVKGVKNKQNNKK